MKSFLLSICAIVLSFGLGIADVEAKRIGGGGSFGMQRQMTPTQPRQSTTTAPQQSTQQATTTQPRRSWMGPIAGLAAGLGLAALFSHLGLSEELASFVMLALLVGGAVLLFRTLARSRRAEAGPAMQYAGLAGHDNRQLPRAAPAPAASAAGPMPQDFDAAAFVRQAKVHFIRLQAANDTGNLEDIREFTTPEMFAELSLQIRDRGAAPQRTDVLELDGEVLEVVEEPHRFTVSVRFAGTLREEEGAAPIAFDEIWHLTKSRSSGSGWVLAGIQQVS